jgi:hypothetical protein
MLHDGWFWACAAESMALLGVVGFFVWALRSERTYTSARPRPDERLADDSIEIGSVPGSVTLDFNRCLTGMTLDPNQARKLSSVILRAADEADSRSDEASKVQRVTAWERISRD